MWLTAQECGFRDSLVASMRNSEGSCGTLRSSPLGKHKKGPNREVWRIQQWGNNSCVRLYPWTDLWHLQTIKKKYPNMYKWRSAVACRARVVQGWMLKRCSLQMTVAPGRTELVSDLSSFVSGLSGSSFLRKYLHSIESLLLLIDSSFEFLRKAPRFGLRLWHGERSFWLWPWHPIWT